LQRGYFEADGIRKLMNDHLYGGKVFTGRIWRLLMFELWHRNFLEKFTKPAGLFSLPVVADLGFDAAAPTPTMATAPAGE
jgi:hypothetical protein